MGLTEASPGFVYGAIAPRDGDFVRVMIHPAGDRFIWEVMGRDAVIDMVTPIIPVRRPTTLVPRRADRDPDGRGPRLHGHHARRGALVDGGTYWSKTTPASGPHSHGVAGSVIFWVNGPGWVPTGGHYELAPEIVDGDEPTYHLSGA